MIMENYPFNNTDDWRDRGYYLRQPPVVIACYDPAGDGNDRDAVVLLNREEHQHGEPHDPDFAVAIKFRVLGSTYLPPEFEFPDKLARLLALHRQLTGWTHVGKIHTHFFTVESNGVGWALASSLKVKVGPRVISYTTVGTVGNKPYENGKLSMPRLTALDHVRVLLETGHLKMAKEAKGARDLTQELGSFVWRRPGRPEALEGQRDDMVMALTGGCWVGSKVIAPVLKAKVIHLPTSRRRAA